MSLNFPAVRMRRRRSADWMRRMVQESQLTVDDLIWPIFVQEQNGETDISSLPGVKRYGPDRLPDVAAQAASLGIPAVAIFPQVPGALKTSTCEEAWNPENLVCRSLQLIAEQKLELGLIADVALDPYNPSGQDGLQDDQGRVLNDETIDALIKQARVLAEAGAQILAPSDMMDGRISALRSDLDALGYQDTALMSYAAKYASAFYGPFREAVGSASALKGDKRSYQMNPANGREAEMEIQLDLSEGADMLIVKPGLPYLDIIYRASQMTAVPVYGYQVSGEYAMLKAAAINGWLDETKTVNEALMAFKRAGASGIWTYAALELALAMQP